MSKGNQTRQQILDAAHQLASAHGLKDLTIGALAREVGMSKSGLFAHFQSKQNLQLALLEHVSQCFTEQVVAPALSCPRGIPRLTALFENWIAWHRSVTEGQGGCVVVAAASEFDDEPGPIKDYLQQIQNSLMEVIKRVAQTAIDEKHFRSDADTEQFSFDAYSIMLGFHHFHRLLNDAQAQKYLKKGFDQLILFYSVHSQELYYEQANV